jgi:hypothetical protein
LKSEESRLDDLSDDASLGDVDENDPRSIARWARKMGEQLGDDAGDEFREMVDQLESGEMPDESDGPGGDDVGAEGGFGPADLAAGAPGAFD